MLTLKEYLEIYEEVYQKIDDARSLASRTSTKGNFFEPIGLRIDAEKYLKQMEKARGVYLASPLYKGKDFTDYVAKLRSNARDFEELSKKYAEIAKNMK